MFRNNIAVINQIAYLNLNLIELQHCLAGPIHVAEISGYHVCL
jgi:hypothetical protein